MEAFFVPLAHLSETKGRNAMQNKRNFPHMLNGKLMTLFLSASALTLSSCATFDKLAPEATVVSADVPVSPASAEGEAPNTKWVEAAPADLPRTDWVAEFSDTTLDSLVERALDANTDIRVAEAGYRAALARLRISKANLLPSISGSTQVSRSENIGNLLSSPEAGVAGDFEGEFNPALLDLGGGVSSGQTGLGGGINGSWEYDLWGRIRAGRRQVERAVRGIK